MPKYFVSIGLVIEAVNSDTAWVGAEAIINNRRIEIQPSNWEVECIDEPELVKEDSNG